MLEAAGVLLQLSPADETKACQALVLVLPSVCERLLHQGLDLGERVLAVSMHDISDKQGKNLQGKPSPDFLNDSAKPNANPDLEGELYAIVNVAAHSTSSARDIEVIFSLYDPESSIVLGVLELGWFVFSFKDQRCFEHLLKIEYLSAGKTFLQIQPASNDVTEFMKNQRILHKEPLIFTKKHSGSSICILDYVSYGYGSSSLPAQIASTETTCPHNQTVNKMEVEVCFSLSTPKSWKPEYRLNLECKPRDCYSHIWRARQRVKEAMNMMDYPQLWGGSAVIGSDAVPRAIFDMVAHAERRSPDAIQGGDLGPLSDSEAPLSHFSEPFLDFSESSVAQLDIPEMLNTQPIRQTRRTRGLRVQLEQKVVTTVRLTDGSGVSYRQILEEDNVWEFRI